jgi:PAS domain S-box-containing protein
VNLASWLFNPAGLTPHGFCLLWHPGLLWLHAGSDAIIGLAYFTIPFVLLSIAQCRPDFALRRLVGLFAAFILLCGLGHWIEVLTLWVPIYGLAGINKALTAAVSVATAGTLWCLMPQVLKWPSTQQLNQATADLRLLRETEARLTAAVIDSARSKEELTNELALRQAAEVAMAESEERYRVLLQSVVDEALYLMDAEGRIETWNAGAVRMKGYAPAEIIGRSFALFFPPDDVANGEPGRILAVAGECGRYDTEGWRIRKDGSRFLAHAAVHAIRRNDGTLRGFAKVTRDITHRAAEEEQRAIIIEAAPNGMMIVDEAGMITLANSQAERLFDYPRGALIGQSVELLVPDGFRTMHRNMQSKFTSGQNVRAMAPNREVTGRRRDGNPVAIEVLLSPVSTPRGRIVITSVIDVTERQRQAKERQDIVLRERLLVEANNASLERLSRQLAKARDKAERANTAKSRFLAGMSHELRTPLNGILGYAQLLHIEGGLNAQQRQRVDAMQKAGKHLLEMISCALDLSEIELEHAVCKTVETDALALAAAALDVVRPAAERKSLSLSLEPCAAEHCLVITDPTRLRQIILNLLGNAIKYTPSGSVALRLRPASGGSALRMEVADSGPGIPLAHREKIFMEFERLDNAATKAVEGAGLGLSLCLRFATLLGAKLTYEDNPDGGSIFALEVPAMPMLPAAKPVAGEPEIDEVFTVPSLRNLRVLVVDDLPMNRDIAESFLQAAGHRPICVESGAEAITAAAAMDFDTILMDVRMPEMDGLEATRRIRAIEGRRGQVPIVALTAHAFADQIQECHEAGMSAHLAKPFDAATLVLTVEKAVRAGNRDQPDPAARKHPAAATAATEPADHAQQAPLEGFDQARFDQAMRALRPEMTSSYLHTLVTLGEALTQQLSDSRELDATDRELLDPAHKLAGSAGIFGFVRVSALVRQFEGILRTGNSVPPEARREVCDALEEMSHRLERHVAAPPSPSSNIGAASHQAAGEPVSVA